MKKECWESKHLFDQSHIWTANMLSGFLSWGPLLQWGKHTHLVQNVNTKGFKRQQVQISNACTVDYRGLYLQPCSSDRATMVRITSIKMTAPYLCHTFFLHMDEYTIKGMQSQQCSLPLFSAQSKAQSKPWFIQQDSKSVTKISRESDFVSTLNQVSAAYSVLTWHEGGVKQQGAFLGLLERQFSTKHQSDAIVVHDSRQLLSRRVTFKILNMAGD